MESLESQIMHVNTIFEHIPILRLPNPFSSTSNGEEDEEEEEKIDTKNDNLMMINYLRLKN